MGEEQKKKRNRRLVTFAPTDKPSLLYDFVTTTETTAAAVAAVEMTMMEVASCYSSATFKEDRRDERALLFLDLYYILHDFVLPLLSLSLYSFYTLDTSVCVCTIRTHTFVDDCLLHPPFICET